MSYFTHAELPENKYYIFGNGGGRKLAERFDVPFLGEIPIIQSISEAGDIGKPVALNQNPLLDVIFGDIASKIAQQISISNAQIAN